jgi:hypothetical protein
MLIHSASQLLTLTPNPQRGKQLGELGLIKRRGTDSGRNNSRGGQHS